MPTTLRSSLNCSGQLCWNVGQEVFSPALLIFLVHRKAHPSGPDRRLGPSERPEISPEDCSIPKDTELGKGEEHEKNQGALWRVISALPSLTGILCSSIAIPYNFLKLVVNSPFCAFLRY